MYIYVCISFKNEHLKVDIEHNIIVERNKRWKNWVSEMVQFIDITPTIEGIKLMKGWMK